ncbi:MAG TPA: hypothetical protein PKA64_01760 [Myxococcota bacterium]|nr:hypothetical protein [Myxococcota bacterium]
MAPSLPTIVSLIAGLFCISMVPSFWQDWLAAAEVSEESGLSDSDASGTEGLSALLHAVLAALFAIGFLAFAAQNAQVP